MTPVHILESSNVLHQDLLHLVLLIQTPHESMWCSVPLHLTISPYDMHTWGLLSPMIDLKNSISPGRTTLPAWIALKFQISGKICLLCLTALLAWIFFADYGGSTLGQVCISAGKMALPIRNIDMPWWWAGTDMVHEIWFFHCWASKDQQSYGRQHMKAFSVVCPGHADSP